MKRAVCLAILLIVTPCLVFAQGKTKKITIDENLTKDYQLLADKCVGMIKSRLHDPSSANIPNAMSIMDYPSKFYVGQRKKGVVTVQFEIQAKNAFNALRRSTAECQWRKDKDGYDLVKVRNF